jgi:hypothetical protein
MQLHHIKGLDIVENEVHRIMPNSLTEKWLSGSLFDEENEKKKQNKSLMIWKTKMIYLLQTFGKQE